MPLPHGGARVPLARDLPGRPTLVGQPETSDGRTIREAWTRSPVGSSARPLGRDYHVPQGVHEDARRSAARYAGRLPPRAGLRVTRSIF